MKKLIYYMILASSTTSLLNVAAAPSFGRYEEDRIPTRVVHTEYVQKYGLPISQSEWNKRGKTGKIICKLNNGVVQTKSYKEGILDGESTYSFPHRDEIETIEVYSSGTLQKTTFYTINRHAYKETQQLGNGGQRITLWYESGAPQSIETYMGDLLEEGEYYTVDSQVESKVHHCNGERHRRDSFGQLLSVDTFEEGQMVCMKTFYPNGSPKESVSYANGVMHGIRRTYHTDGAPDCVEEWSCGVQDGMATYYVNGEMHAQIPYSQGLKHGVERRFSDNGQTLASEVSWSNHLRHGPSCTYINGQPVQNEWYHKGKQVSKKNYDVLNTLPTIH